MKNGGSSKQAPADTGAPGTSTPGAAVAEVKPAPVAAAPKGAGGKRAGKRRAAEAEQEVAAAPQLQEPEKVPAKHRGNLTPRGEADAVEPEAAKPTDAARPAQPDEVPAKRGRKGRGKPALQEDGAATAAEPEAARSAGDAQPSEPVQAPAAGGRKRRVRTRLQDEGAGAAEPDEAAVPAEGGEGEAPNRKRVRKAAAAVPDSPALPIEEPSETAGAYHYSIVQAGSSLVCLMWCSVARLRVDLHLLKHGVKSGWLKIGSILGRREQAPGQAACCTRAALTSG